MTWCLVPSWSHDCVVESEHICSTPTPTRPNKTKMMGGKYVLLMTVLTGLADTQAISSTYNCFDDQPPRNVSGICDVYDECLTNSSTCTQCFHDLDKHHVTYGLQHAILDQLQEAFYKQSRNRTLCTRNDLEQYVLPMVKAAKYSRILGCEIGPFDTCMQSILDCNLMENCMDCVSHLRQTKNFDALNKSICQGVEPHIIEKLAFECVNFPSCTYVKWKCQRNSTCSNCYNQLLQGNIQASAQCQNRELDDIVSQCSFYSASACAYWRGRISDNMNLQPCLSQMGYGTDPEVIAVGSMTTECTHAQDSGVHLVSQYINACSDNCARSVYYCTMGQKDNASLCAKCFLGEQGCTSRGLCMVEERLSNPCFTDCDESWVTANRLALATMVIGIISVLACLSVVAVILAHSRDLISLRERLILSMMIANLVYSSANALDLQSVELEPGKCGQISMSYEAQTFGRAWWFCGKFAIVLQELLIVSVSILALYNGTTQLVRWKEWILQAIPALAGLIALFVFYFKALDINDAGYNQYTFSASRSQQYEYFSPNDDGDDENVDAKLAYTYSSQQYLYNKLKEQMLQSWLFFLALVVVLYVASRRMYVMRFNEWIDSVREKEEEWNRDLWHEGAKVERTVKVRLVQLIREAYDEIARPLEPYIVVFVVFGIPAVVMATDYCTGQSQIEIYEDQPTYKYTNSGAKSTKQCEITCELILALRSLATVAVYYARLERRSELIHPIIVVRKLWSRTRELFTCGRHGRVKFDKNLTRVKLFEKEDVHSESDASDDDKDTNIDYAAYIEGED